MLDFVNSYASVIGTYHIDNNIPNQDSCFYINDGNIIVLTVSDGLGSREKSHYGSSAVGESVYNAFKLWIREKSIKLVKFISLIIQEWEAKFSNPNEYSATCLFAVIYNNKMYLGQIGDGILAYSINETVNILIKHDKDFSNCTDSIDDSLVDDWKFKSIDIENEDKIVVLMATDGIADTLILDNINDFINYIIKEVSIEKNKNEFLEKLAFNWKSIDDKTIAIIYN